MSRREEGEKLWSVWLWTENAISWLSLFASLKSNISIFLPSPLVLLLFYGLPAS
jgi:hypothetical protein